jgi:hypothetical protein
MDIWILMTGFDQIKKAAFKKLKLQSIIQYEDVKQFLTGYARILTYTAQVIDNKIDLKGCQL